MESTQAEQNTQEEKSSGPSNTRTWVTLVACFFELIFFGGSIFGWASLAFVFKADGLFSLSCPDPITTFNHSSNITGHPEGANRTQYIECVSQEESLSLVFTVGIAFFGLTSFPVGFIFDKFGLKLTRLFAAMTGCCGYLLLAFADKDVSWFLFPGMACVATSCITMILTNSYIGRMAGKKSSTIITLYAGSISSSVVVFLVVKLLHDVGISRKLTLSVLAGLWVPSLLITFFLLPSQKTSSCCPTANKVSPNNNQPKPTDPTTVVKDGGVDHKELSKPGIETGSADKKSSTPSENLLIRYLLGNRVVPDAVSDMLSLLYLMYIYWYCVLHVRIQFFISQFNVWVSSLVDQDIAQVSHFTNVLGYAMMFSIVISPLGGILIDSRRSLLKDMVPGQGCRSIVALPCLVVTAVSSMMLCLLIYCKQPYLIYVIVIFTEIYRSFFYATGLALLELSFPKEHYGRLFGLARSISGVMSFLQYPYVLFANTFNHGIIIVNIFLLVTVLLSMMLPLYIVLLYVRHKRQVAAQGNTQAEDVRF